MIDSDLKVLIDFVRNVPKGRNEEFHLNRLDTLVDTVRRNEDFAPLQLGTLKQLGETLSAKALGLSRIGRFFMRIFFPKALDKRVVQAVARHLTTVTVAYYNPWMFKAYIPHWKEELHSIKAQLLLQRARTLHSSLSRLSLS